MWGGVFVCIRSSLHSVRYGQLLRCPHKSIFNIMKVYIERMNMQVKLIRLGGEGRGGEGRGGQGRAGEGRAGQGRAGQGRAGQGRAGEGRGGEGRGGEGGRGGRGGEGRGGEGRRGEGTVHTFHKPEPL